MDDSQPSALAPETEVAVRYWAGARAAAGVEREMLPASTVGQVREAAVVAHPSLAEVMPRCTVLVDGLRSEDDAPVRPASNIEVLPPFAGG